MDEHLYTTRPKVARFPNRKTIFWGMECEPEIMAKVAFILEENSDSIARSPESILLMFSFTLVLGAAEVAHSPPSTTAKTGIWIHYGMYAHGKLTRRVL